MKTIHDLDAAIDRVAKQMTSVEKDEALALRIMSLLPERSTWPLHWLMPRVAVLVMIVVAGVMWSSRRAPAELAPLVSLAAPNVMTTLRASIEAEPNRTKPSEHLEFLEPLEPHADHEFSLPSLGAVTALAVSDLSPPDLPEDGALIVEPLEIADLPLTNDFPR